MCGRFVSARERQQLIDEFGIERDQVTGDLAPDYNVAPTDSIYAVMTRAPRESREAPPVRELHAVRWGLIPSWAKDLSGAGRLINARAETVTEKPSFRNAFARRRCLIPADGYYEWMTEGKAKQPYYIYRADGGLLAFAGIYELWRNSEFPEDHQDAWYWSASIVTTQAADEIGRIHDRTPMVIAPDNWGDWLDPANKDKELMLAAMRPATSGPGGLTSHKVSTEVNSVRNNGSALIEPLGDDTELSGSSDLTPLLHS
jgi:putative SOS response-associated peptidase YedK